MSLRELRKIGCLLAATGVIAGQFALGFTPAFAVAGNNNNNNNNNNGELQLVWCKLTGNSWKAELAANGNGKDGALYGPVVGYTVDGHNQVLAHDRSDKLDAECAKQHVITTVIPVPANPGANDPCNPVGSPEHFSNVTWKTVTSGTGYTWSLSKDGKTYTATAKDGYVFGPSKLHTVSYQLAKDDGDTCPVVIPEPSVPAAPTFDDMTCEVNDTVSYTIPSSEDFYYTVQIGDGSATKATSGVHTLSRVAQTVTIKAYTVKEDYDHKDREHHDGDKGDKLVQTWTHTFAFPTCTPGTGNEGGTPETTTTETPVVAAPVTAAQTAELPHTGPASSASVAMSMAVLPVLAYGLTYLIRQRFEQ